MNSSLSEDQIKGLKRLMEPFDKSEISKLPKPTAAQTKEVRDDYKKGVRCEICGGWHHPKVVHLDYVGHAALTKRLLEVDPLWNWEPFAVNDIGEPRLDDYGGMWGWLIVCGVRRRGYGDAEGKVGSNANKERIGDFLRNAAMRFGAALDLWSKADLTKLGIADDGHGAENVGHPQADDKKKKSPPAQPPPKEQKPTDRTMVDKWLTWVDSFTKSGASVDQFIEQWDKYAPAIQKLPKEHLEEVIRAKKEMEIFLMEGAK